MRHLIQSYLQNYFYKSNINLKSLKTFNFVENKIRACVSMDFLAFASSLALEKKFTSSVFNSRYTMTNNPYSRPLWQPMPHSKP